MNLRELLARQAELKHKGKKLAYVNGIDATGGDRTMSAEETKEFEGILAELRELDGKIAAAQQRAEQLRAIDAPGATVAGGTPTQVQTVHVGQDRAALDPTGGFQSFGQFAQAVHAASRRDGFARVDDRLVIIQAAAPANTHREGSSDEGYMVPAQFRDRVWQAVERKPDNFINQVDVEETNSNALNDMTDDTTPWGGGVQAHWRAEAEQMTASRLAPEKPRTLHVHQLYAFVVASEELIADAPRLTSRLEKKVPEAIAWKIDDAILYGNGVGKPLGIYNSGALVSVAKEGGQGADTILADNIIKMYMRMLPGSIPNAYWRMNSNCLMQIMKLKFVDDSPMWVSDYREAPGGRLLGRPIFFSQHSKTLGDKGDIAFMDMKGYYAARRSDVQRAESIHLYFDYNLRAFRSIVRIGGQPHLQAPVMPMNSTDGQSHFVTLDERA